MVFSGDNAESYYDEGVTARMKGDFVTAALYFERAAKMDPQLTSARHQLAKCCMRMGKSDQAVALLQQVIREKPGLIAARLDLGDALMEMGHNDHARKLFEEVLASGRDNARAYQALAQLSFNEAQWVQASSLAQIARSHGAAGFPVLYLLGRASKQAGDITTSSMALEEARIILDKTVELNPEMPEGYFLRGEVWFASDAFPKALEDYRAAETRTAADKVYSIFGESFSLADIVVRQGLTLWRLNLPADAKAAGERALGLDPGNKLAKSLTES